MNHSSFSPCLAPTSAEIRSRRQRSTAPSVQQLKVVVHRVLRRDACETLFERRVFELARQIEASAESPLTRQQMSTRVAEELQRLAPRPGGAILEYRQAEELQGVTIMAGGARTVHV